MLSTKLRWLLARITGPVGGTWSSPVTVGRQTALASGGTTRVQEPVEHALILPHPVAGAGRGSQRCQTYGVLVVTATSPERSRIGRDIAVQSLLM